jgi:hypothetical protein
MRRQRKTHPFNKQNKPTAKSSYAKAHSRTAGLQTLTYSGSRKHFGLCRLFFPRHSDGESVISEINRWLLNGGLLLAAKPVIPLFQPAFVATTLIRANTLQRRFAISFVCSCNSLVAIRVPSLCACLRNASRIARNYDFLLVDLWFRSRFALNRQQTLGRLN